MSADAFGQMMGPHAKRLDKPAEKAARAAMGIPDEATVVPMDMTRSPLFVCAFEDDDGGLQIMARATIGKRPAASLLRQIAEQWEAQADEEGEGDGAPE
ncbi:hypothetical protein SEA_NICOLE72_69 [Microbacterium phage Nicole72]|uniref:Uncharacterized protein n=1 Tax=Microbacterium phage Nicole72 TaxID=3062838 RepID=A0ACD4UJK0_9CAUD|nr:hypothetical protein SEA_NICOLE72_69 [Microbacterium phage Nicole72]